LNKKKRKSKIHLKVYQGTGKQTSLENKLIDYYSDRMNDIEGNVRQASPNNKQFQNETCALNKKYDHSLWFK